MCSYKSAKGVKIVANVLRQDQTHDDDNGNDKIPIMIMMMMIVQKVSLKL